MSIILHKFGTAWGLSDPSPFCVKLESFLRINDIDHKIGDLDMRAALERSPKKKLPFVTLENGKDMGDSTMIINFLSKEKNIDMDAALSDEQRAISHAYRRMLDEGTYFAGLYSRWVDDAGWAVIKPTFFKPVPALLRNFISEKVRKDIAKSAYKQGTGRHAKDEVYATAARDLDALSALLGDKDWYFGTDKPTLLDVWAHAFVIENIIPPIETDLKKIALERENICNHAKRFQEMVYGK